MESAEHIPPLPPDPIRCLSHELKCGYAYKNCPNPRTIKDNGELHSLCEYHRSKANIVQKKYAKRRRHRKRQEKLAAASLLSSGKGKKRRIPSKKATTIDPIPYHNTSEEEEMKMEIVDETNSFTNDDVEMLRDLI